MSYGDTPVLEGVDLDIASGEIVVLLGPSGCGKTTLLRLIAGLDPLDGGTVAIDGRVVSGPTAHVPSEDRGVGLVFQDGALFPHLTVARNVGFGLPRAERRQSPRIDAMLELVGLAGLGDRMPQTLSGGQRQRVGLARALAPSPRVLLLDEPFASLDSDLRTALRREVHGILRASGVTAILVTHDRFEAFAVGDRIALLADCCIVQAGTPEALYRTPRNRWAATALGEGAFLDAAMLRDEVVGQWSEQFRTTRQPLEDGAWVVRPEDLMAIDGADPRALPAQVLRVEYQGGSTLLWCRVGTAGFEPVVRTPAPAAVGQVLGLRFSR